MKSVAFWFKNIVWFMIHCREVACNSCLSVVSIKYQRSFNNPPGVDPAYQGWVGLFTFFANIPLNWHNHICVHYRDNLWYFKKPTTFKADAANEKAEKEEESKEKIAIKIERFLGGCKEEEGLKQLKKGETFYWYIWTWFWSFVCGFSLNFFVTSWYNVHKFLRLKLFPTPI